MTLKILVADDSITIQKIVGMAFEKEDAEVEGIGDGQEALGKIMEFKPDIVLADVDMPGLDGFQLAKKIKENPDLAKIKVLLLASDLEDFDEDRFKKCHAANHISKPFKSDDIVQMVARVMEGGAVAEVTDELPLQNSVLEQGKNEDDEPSLEELLESVEKLSTDSVNITETPIEESENSLKSSELEETSQEVEEPNQEEEINEGSSTIIDDDILSGIIQEGKNFSPEPEKEESVLENQTFSDEVCAEVQTRKMESPDALDSAFKEIVAGEKKQQQAARPETRGAEMSLLGGIIPEPEDLLERMAPRVFSEPERGAHNQEAINENLGAITGPSSFGSSHYQDPSLSGIAYDNKDDRFIQVMGEQVKHLLQKSLDSSLQKEMFGLSDMIVKTIREVVREMAPEIAKSIIREEINKTKNL